MVLVACLLPLPALSDAVVASWNIENLGWINGKVLPDVAEVASRCDVIAVQEVISEEAARAVGAAL